MVLGFSAEHNNDVDVLQAARYGDLEDVQSSLAQRTSVSSLDTQGRTGMQELLLTQAVDCYDIAFF